MPLNSAAADFVPLFPVKFAPENHCYKKPEKSAKMIALVREYRDKPTKATRAVIVNGWHTSTKDKKDHLTVDWYNGDKRIDRMHIHRRKKKNNV